MKTVVFRSDASLLMGIGHVQRCLTLADALRRRGASCVFVCRSQKGDLVPLIQQRGYRVLAVEDQEQRTVSADRDEVSHASWLGTEWATDANATLRLLAGTRADWLVVDHYALDWRWERAVRPACDRLLAIDDLADRRHDCDVLLDQNLGRTPDDYHMLLNADCSSLIGPAYALLRPEFAAQRAQSLARRSAPSLRHLVVSMGGVDPGNATCRVLDALDQVVHLAAHCRIAVIMGPHAPWISEVHKRAAAMRRPTEVMVNITNMAEVMTSCDLVIGGAGSTAWERCALGVPSLMAVLAHNQQEAAAALVAAGAARAFKLDAHMVGDFREFFERVDADPHTLANMCMHAKEVCDGHGADRVCEILSQAKG